MFERSAYGVNLVGFCFIFFLVHIRISSLLFIVIDSMRTGKWHTEPRATGSGYSSRLGFGIEQTTFYRTLQNIHVTKLLQVLRTEQILWRRVHVLSYSRPWNFRFCYQRIVHVDGIRLCLWTATTDWPTVCPRDDVCVWRPTMEWYWKGKPEKLGENPVPVPLCPPQIPHGLTRASKSEFVCYLLTVY
jgi:hypothetical protein